MEVLVCMSVCQLCQTHITNNDFMILRRDTVRPKVQRQKRCCQRKKKQKNNNNKQRKKLRIALHNERGSDCVYVTCYARISY